MTTGPFADTDLRQHVPLPPDVSLCPACREERRSSDNRRRHDPFLACARCGPGFSLGRAIPFARETSALACFPLCPECSREASDPEGRRRSAATSCCPDCGPQLWLQPSGGQRSVNGAKAIDRARHALAEGQILALKDTGGFRLLCRADLEPAILRLRLRKGRTSRPFAVLVRDLDVARQLAELRPADEDLLAGPRAPILIAPRRPDPRVCDAVAPGLADLGLLLPSTALHLELFRDLPHDCLAVTSGNLAAEPIARGNREALLRLREVADFFLLHDRDVVRRVEDSVARTGDESPIWLRRSLGWVPEPLPLPLPTPQPLIALGGRRQVAVCFAAGELAWPSQHVGELTRAEGRSFHLEAADGLEELTPEKPEMIVVSAFPDAPGARLGEQIARSKGAGLLRLPHHLAHLAAAAAEHGRFPAPKERFGGIVLDGGGWGPDGTDWGGEVLELDGGLRWRRAGHLEPLPLVGGQAAEREPWRLAVAALVQTGKFNGIGRLPLAFGVNEVAWQAVAELVTQPNWAVTASAGRLFDAAGALFGLCARNGYDGEGALRFEALAATDGGEVRPWPEIELDERGSRFTLPTAELLGMAADRLLQGEPAAAVAVGFHDAFCRLVSRLAHRALSPEVRVIAIGGDCLSNRLLRRGLRSRLGSFGYDVLMSTWVPPGDGGLAYGQAVLAAAALQRGAEPRLIQAGTWS